MSARPIISKLFLVFLLLLIAVPTFFYLRSPKKADPDVIMIVIDTLRKDRLGCYGYPKAISPQIDAFSKVATRYDNVKSHASWTTPAVASMLTSRFPWQLGITNRASKLPLEATTIAETLSDNGYQTAAVYSAVHLGPSTQFDQGFQTCLQEKAPYDGSPAKNVSDKGIELIEKSQEQDKPLFLLLHYFDPHAGYVLHKEHALDDPNNACTPEDFDPSMRWAELIEKKEHFASTPKALGCLNRTYDSEITWTDAHIGRVMDALKASKRFENAIIIVTADHGEEFLDHNGFGHGHTLYKELINVPLLVKTSGQSEGNTISAPVTHTDIMPTVLSLLNIDIPKEAVGSSLNKAELPPVRPIVSETTLFRSHLRSVTYGNFKLIADLKNNTQKLYDLTLDPKEITDLAVSSGENVEKLKSLMAIAAGEQTISASNAAFSDEEKEMLNSLGYVE